MLSGMYSTQGRVTQANNSCLGQEGEFSSTVFYGWVQFFVSFTFSS